MPYIRKYIKTAVIWLLHNAINYPPNQSNKKPSAVGGKMEQSSCVSVGSHLRPIQSLGLGDIGENTIKVHTILLSLGFFPLETLRTKYLKQVPSWVSA